MSLSRWKMMAGVLGVSIGGLAAAASQCPKLDKSKGRQPEKPVTTAEAPKLPPAGAPSTPAVPMPASAAPQLVPSGSTPPLPTPASATESPKIPAPATTGGLPPVPDFPVASPEPKPAKPPEPALPALPGIPAPGNSAPAKPTVPTPVADAPGSPKSIPTPPDLAPPMPGKPSSIPPAPGFDFGPAPGGMGTTPPGKPVVGASGVAQPGPVTTPPNVGSATPPGPQVGGGFVPPPPMVGGSAPGMPPVLPIDPPAATEVPPTKPMAPPAAIATKYRILLRVGEGEPTFEVKDGDNLVLKVACEKVDIESPEKGQGPSKVTARGKVRFAGFGAEGTCDSLSFMSGTGEVQMTGDVKVQVKDKLGRVESELSTASMKYKIDASAVGGSLKP